ncbi:MAG: zinc-dependent alcohol dehydrogenase family protein [Anaerolineales bacterium]
MKAMVLKEFGTPDVLEMQEVSKPEPGANEVLVKVKATSVNPVDTKIRQAGSWAVEPPAVIGYDVSGIVEAVGETVFDLVPGDEVYYTSEIGPGGSYAEYQVVNQAIVAHKPKNLSHKEAASIPLAGCTAWEALITRTWLRPAESVLIHGAGGVGSLAVQIAKAAGAKVFAVCSDYMVDGLKKLGVDRPINYKNEDFQEIVASETGGAGVDVVLDTVGDNTLTKSIPVTRPFGRMASIVSNKADLSAAGSKNLTVHFVSMQRDRYKLNELRKMIERRQLNPVIDSVIPLANLAEAHQRLEKGGVKGKLVLQVAA